MTFNKEELDLLSWENLLNTMTGKRYHIRIDTEYCKIWTHLVEVISMGEEKIIVKGLSEDQMRAWLIHNVKVSIN